MTDYSMHRLNGYCSLHACIQISKAFIYLYIFLQVCLFSFFHGVELKNLNRVYTILKAKVCGSDRGRTLLKHCQKQSEIFIVDLFDLRFVNAFFEL